MKFYKEGRNPFLILYVIILSYLIVLFFWVQVSIIQTIQKLEKIYPKFLTPMIQTVKWKLSNFLKFFFLFILHLLCSKNHLSVCLSANKINVFIMFHLVCLYHFQLVRQPLDQVRVAL